MNLTEEEYKAMVLRVARNTRGAVAQPSLPPPTDNPEVIRKALLLGFQPSTDESKLNKTETRYLAWLRTLGDYWIGIQCITLKLGHDCRYTPDFWAVDKDGMRAIDCKGTRDDGTPQVEEDAMVKMRVAARLFPFARFLLAWKTASGWQHREIKP
jgi:hypothetical protein